MDGGNTNTCFVDGLQTLVGELIAANRGIYELRQQVRDYVTKMGEHYRTVVEEDGGLAIRYGAIGEPLKVVRVEVPEEYLKQLPMSARS